MRGRFFDHLNTRRTRSVRALRRLLLTRFVHFAQSFSRSDLGLRVRGVSQYKLYTSLTARQRQKLGFIRLDLKRDDRCIDGLPFRFRLQHLPGRENQDVLQNRGRRAIVAAGREDVVWRRQTEQQASTL